MRDDVVELAGDSAALFGDGDAGCGGALPLSPGSAVLRIFGLRRALTYRGAGKPSAHEHHRDEDELAYGATRVVVHENPRPTKHDNEPRPSLRAVRQIAQQ